MKIEWVAKSSLVSKDVLFEAVKTNDGRELFCPVVRVEAILKRIGEIADEYAKTNKVEAIVALAAIEKLEGEIEKQFGKHGLHTLTDASLKEGT